MRRTGFFAAAFLAAALALAPGAAFARAGGGSSFGSRGSMTFSAPRSTSISPGGAAPMSRSFTPQAAPSPGYGSNYGGGYGFGGRSSFTSGLLGGLVGAGIGGLLFGHGMFYGVGSFGGFFGFLIQIFLIVMVVRWLFRRFFGQTAYAGASPGLFARTMSPGMGAGMGVGVGAGIAGGSVPNVGQIVVGPQDYQQFESELQQIQAAWSAQDLNTLRGLTTPEMFSYFAEQLSDQSSRGVRNVVTDVRLENGELSEGWSENGRDYATVAMRYSMIDVTRDSTGRVVEGDATVRTLVTELWTFLRAPGGRWILSAIQQTR